MSDLEFLKELRENVVKGKSDITRHEMALQMIDDWINELQGAEPKKRSGAVCTCRTTYISGVGKVVNATGCPVHSANP